MKCNWDRFFSEHLVFSLSLSVYQCCILNLHAYLIRRTSWRNLRLQIKLWSFRTREAFDRKVLRHSGLKCPKKEESAQGTAISISRCREDEDRPDVMWGRELDQSETSIRHVSVLDVSGKSVGGAEAPAGGMELMADSCGPRAGCDSSQTACSDPACWALMEWREWPLSLGHRIPGFMGGA